MRLTSFEIYKYPIPIEPFVIATGTMYFSQNIFIRIHTDEGIYGVGECSAFPMIVGETQATCFEMAKDFARIWKDKDALDIEARMNELHIYAAGNYTIKSAFDLALYDIAAKHANQPLYKFLGGEKRSIETDLTIGIDTPEGMAQTAVKYKEQGVRIIKIKLGKKIKDDIERVKLIRKAVGDNLVLRLDANQGWSFDDAKLALQEMASYNIEFCEQPMRKHFDYLLPELKKTSPIKLMADESVFTHYDAERIIENDAADFINIKFAKSGGIHEATLINKVAQENNMPCMIGSMLESRLALTANLHFAMANPNIKYYDLDTCLLGQLADPVIGGIRYDNMQLITDDVPGIGADVAQDYLEKHECFKL